MSIVRALDRSSTALGSNNPSFDGHYDLIDTGIVTVAQATMGFNISSENAAKYRNLHVKYVARTASAAKNSRLFVRLNGVTTASYSGAGSGSWGGTANWDKWDLINQTSIQSAFIAGGTSTAGVYGFGELEFFDAFVTTKNKTVSGMGGKVDGADATVSYTSGCFYSTAAISQITLSSDANFAVGSKFYLYGSKGLVA